MSLQPKIQPVAADYAAHATDEEWVHYSNFPELKFNPQQFHQDPLALYLFPTDFQPNPMWRQMKYKFRVKVTLAPEKVLDLSKMTEVKAIEYLERLGIKYIPEYLKSNAAHHFWEQMRNHYGKSRAASWNKDIRSILGFDAVFDDTKAIHYAEEQLLVLDPKLVQVIERESQSDSGYYDLIKTIEYLAELLSPYGKVEVTPPKRTKMYGDVWIEGLVTVAGERPIVWKVSVGQPRPKDKEVTPLRIGVSLKNATFNGFDRSVGVSIDRFGQNGKSDLDLGQIDKEVKWAMDKLIPNKATANGWESWEEKGPIYPEGNPAEVPVGNPPYGESPVVSEKEEAGIDDVDYPYYHVSNHPETPSIHKETDRGKNYVDPYGIYLFPKKEHVDVEEWGRKAYRWDAKLKPGAKVRSISMFDQGDKWKFFKKAGIKSYLDFFRALSKAKCEEDKVEFDFMQSYISDVDGDPDHPTEEDLQKAFAGDQGIPDVMWFRALRSKFNNRDKFTTFWKSTGLDGIIDDSNAIYAGEPQLIIFNPDVIEWGPRETNSIDKEVYKLREQYKRPVETFITAAQNKPSFKKTPTLWDGKSMKDSYMAFADKVYVVEGNEVQWIKDHIDIPESDLYYMFFAHAAGEDEEQELEPALPTEIPKEFFMMYQTAIYARDMFFKTFKADENFQTLILKIYTARRDKPSNITIETVTPSHKKSITTQAFLKNGMKSLAGSDEYIDEGHVDGNWGSQASGILFKCKDTILLLYRNFWVMDPNTWGIPGGAVPVKADKTPMDVRESALREVDEEIGGIPSYHDTGKKTVKQKGAFKYTTFLFEVPEEFGPILNNEHTDAKWFKLDELPEDIHPGVAWSIDQLKLKEGEEAKSESGLGTIVDERLLNKEWANQGKFLRGDEVAPYYADSPMYDPVMSPALAEYFTPSSELSISEVIEKWKAGDKGYDARLALPGGELYHGFYPLDEVLKYKEFDRPLKSDLYESIKEKGFTSPIILMVAQKGSSYVGEGNHRLAVAKKLGIKEVPVRFIFIREGNTVEASAGESFLPEYLVMVDCEMTGVVPKRDALLQIAMTRLKLQEKQYVEEGEPLVLYLEHKGKPQNDFHRKHLQHIFDRCNNSTLQPGEAKEKICDWLGELKGKVVPCGDCVPTDMHFLKEKGCIDESDIGDSGPIPGTFHYEYFDMNAPKALSRFKEGKKEDKKSMSGFDEENIHDALVDCRNQTLELNYVLRNLLKG